MSHSQKRQSMVAIQREYSSSESTNADWNWNRERNDTLSQSTYALIETKRKDEMSHSQKRQSMVAIQREYCSSESTNAHWNRNRERNDTLSQSTYELIETKRKDEMSHSQKRQSMVAIQREYCSSESTNADWNRNRERNDTLSQSTYSTDRNEKERRDEPQPEEAVNGSNSKGILSALSPRMLTGIGTESETTHSHKVLTH